MKADAFHLNKTNDIVVNAALRHMFSTMTRLERESLYRETPYNWSGKKA